MDLSRFVSEFVSKGRMRAIATDPRLQFGTTFEPLLFAKYLPVVTKNTNLIAEDQAEFGQGVADDGSELSPPQIKNPGTSGSTLTVRLGHIDLAMQVDAVTLDTLRSLAGIDNYAAAELVFSEWLALNIRLAIETKAELQRIEAITLAQVTIRNKDGQSAIVALPNPSGSRVTVPSGTLATPTGWYSPTYDPMADILAAATYLKNRVNAVIFSSRILGVLLRSPAVRQSMGGTVSVTATGGLAAAPSVATRSGLDNYFLSMGLPAPTINDAEYTTQTASARLLDDSKVIFLGSTPQRLRVAATATTGILLTSTLGYYGEGICRNQTNPGMVIASRVSELKPTGIYVEGYREGFPVIQQPRAISVITIPAPA